MQRRVLQVTLNIEYDMDTINREELFEAVSVLVESIEGVTELKDCNTRDKTREYREG